MTVLNVHVLVAAERTVNNGENGKILYHIYLTTKE